MIIPAPSRQACAFTDLHLHIIMRMILILCIDIKPYNPALRMIDQTVLFADLHPLNGKAKHDLQQPRHISSSDITAPNIKLSLIVSSCDRFFLLISFLRSIQRNSKTSITQDFLTFNQFLLDFPPATLAGLLFTALQPLIATIRGGIPGFAAQKPPLTPVSCSYGTCSQCAFLTREQ